jgi:hypothetical protein
MALLERVKERFKPELGDTELQAMIDEAVDAIDKRYGALDASDPVEPIDLTLEGRTRSLFPGQPIDPGAALVIVETEWDTETTLAADDYRVWFGGRRLERLTTGTNPRSVWAPEVTVTFFPVNDQKQRDEVALKLVKLSIDYEGGLEREGIDGYSATFSDYTKERETLLASLAPSSVRMA